MFSKTCLLIWLFQNKQNFFNSLSSDPKNVEVNSTLLPYLCFIFSFWVQISLFKKNCVVGRRTTRNSKYGFGIFRSVLLQLYEEQLRRFTKYQHTFIYFSNLHIGRQFGASSGDALCRRRSIQIVTPLENKRC